MREIKSPKVNVAKEDVLVVQDATTKIKEQIISDIDNGVAKKETEKAIDQIIADAVAKSRPELKYRVKNSLIQSAQSNYWSHSMNVKTLMVNTARTLNRTVPGYSINVQGIMNGEVSPTTFRNYVDNAPKGLAVIKDYRQSVKAEIRAISSNPPVSLREGKDGRVRKVNLRNMAEMTVRYEANTEDVNKLKEENVKLVWTSSHADSSQRCEPFQGRLYSLDGTSGRTADGIAYTPLEDAMAGPLGDGNGIITGYNCRHRLIEYVAGSKAPVDYDKATIRREREIDQTQRQYENTIRNYKSQEALFRANGNSDFADKLHSRWGKLYKAYQEYSLKNGRAYYKWRTQVLEEE